MRSDMPALFSYMHLHNILLQIIQGIKILFLLSITYFCREKVIKIGWEVSSSNSCCLSATFYSVQLQITFEFHLYSFNFSPYLFANVKFTVNISQ